MPIRYSGIVKEHTAVRTAAGLFDVSHMERSGHGSERRVVRRWVGHQRPAEDQAGAGPLHVLLPRGWRHLDDLILYKTADDDVMIVCNASNHQKITSHVTERAAGRAGVTVTDETAETALWPCRDHAFEVPAARTSWAGSPRRCPASLRAEVRGRLEDYHCPHRLHG